MASILAVGASVTYTLLGNASSVVALDPVRKTAARLLQPAPFNSPAKLHQRFRVEDKGA